MEVVVNPGFGRDAQQRTRRLLQASFMLLFFAAPWFDWLRFDITSAQLWVAGSKWSLGIDGVRSGSLDGVGVGLSIVLKGFLPLAAIVGVFLWVSWRWGRLYCGWLCPHFSMVESLNGLLWRAAGKRSVWDRTPEGFKSSIVHWLLFFALAASAGFLWSCALLSYLLPPRDLLSHAISGDLGRGPSIFLAASSIAIGLEMVLARHLFCRFGCAVGFFQSLAWMANRSAMVVSFDRGRAPECRGCQPIDDACERACPMGLRPRQQKRLMFSCVQCGRCLAACSDSKKRCASGSSSLEWRIGEEALRESIRRPPSSGEGS